MGKLLTYNLKMADGKALSAMDNIIKSRIKELGETTVEACTALAINILKSLRAETKVASLRADIEVEDVTSQYTPSWAKMSSGKNAKSVRVLRAGEKGAVVKVDKVIWRTGAYNRGEKYRTYKVVDKISQEKTYTYLMVTKSASEAKKHARNYHKTRVKKNRYLAKYALGLAMHKVHEAQSIGVNTITNEARATGMKNVEVRVVKGGYSSGYCGIDIHDKLEYASKALKSGDGAIQLAIQRALNGMTAYINKRIERKGIRDTLRIPFPELKRG